MNDEPKHFYDPHPGVGGAAVPLPLPLKIAADGLSGKNVPVRQAIEIFQTVAPYAEVRADERRGCIFLSIPFGNGGTHLWRIIRFR